MSGYYGTFKVTNKNNELYFAESITDKYGFIQVTTKPGAYEVEVLDNETRRSFFTEASFSEVDYPFTIKLKFSTLGFDMEVSRHEEFSFTPDGSIRYLLGFNSGTIYEERNISPVPVDISSFDNTFVAADIAQGRFSKLNEPEYYVFFTMDVDL